MNLITGTPAVVAASSVMYYFVFYRPSRIAHDAQLAKAYCSKEVATMIRCQKDVGLENCEREVLFLHNCVHKNKGFNQVDMDFL